MKNTAHKYNWGFTLIEVLVVISIISLLSSIIVASLSVARAKARDAKKISEVKQVANSLTMYLLDKGTMPANPVPGQIAYEGSAEYETVMNELVPKYLGAIPRSPDPTRPYGYYNYGKNTPGGAVFGVNLEAASPSTTGLSGSCRPVSAVDLSGCGMPQWVLYYLNDGSLCPVQGPGDSNWDTWKSQCFVPMNCGTINGSSCINRRYGDGNELLVCNPPIPTGGWCDTVSSTDYCSCNQY